MKGLIILGSWLVAGLIFYLAFFVAAPAVATLIPVSDWKPLLDFVIYFVIAWGGGIAIPLIIGIFGTAVGLNIRKEV